MTAGWIGWRATQYAASIVIGGAAIVAIYLLYNHGEPQRLGGGLLAAASVLALASLRVRPALRVAVAGLALTVYAGLIVADVAVAHSWFVEARWPFLTRVGAPAKADQRISDLRRYGVDVDSEEASDALAALQARQVDAVPSVMLAALLARGAASAGDNSAGDPLLPLGGISNAVTVLCNEGGPYVIYDSDEHGMRNPRGIWSAAHADVAAIGQSWTHQYCIADGKGFVDLLRPRYPVTLNLGVSGQGPLLQLAAIREYLPRYRPTAVLWFYMENVDVYDLYDESTNPLAARYRDPGFSQHLLTRQPEIDRFLRDVVADDEARARLKKKDPTVRPARSGFAQVLKLWALRERLAPVGASRAAEPAWSMLEQTEQNLMSDTLSQAQKMTQSWGGTLYFIYLPSWDRYRNGPAFSDREHRRMLSIVETLGIPSIDILPAFEVQDDPLSLFTSRDRSFGHYNEAGHTLVADNVLKFMAGHN